MVKWFYNSRLAKWLTPLGTCHTITLGWIVLTEFAEDKVSDRLRKHETTHAQQFIELLVIGAIIFALLALLGASFWLIIPCLLLFYVWYLVEWLIRFIIALCDRIKNRDWEIAYENTVFEREANAMEEKNENERLAFGFLCYYLE